MPLRKMRVELYDESGNHYSISLEGRVTRNNALRVVDLVELLGGMPGMGSEQPQTQQILKIDKVRYIAEKHFPLVWFSAKDFQAVYEREANEPIGLSTASTYLSRLSDRGVLMKTKNSNRALYRLIWKDIAGLVKSP